MAKTVATSEEIELQDGTVIEIRPATIKKLKKIMSYMAEPEEVAEDSPTAGIDYIFSIAKMCLEGVVDDELDLEEVVDMPTAKRVIKVMVNVDFDDENLMLAQAALEAAQNGAT